MVTARLWVLSALLLFGCEGSLAGPPDGSGDASSMEPPPTDALDTRGSQDRTLADFADRVDGPVQETASCEATGGATCYYVSPTGTGSGTEESPGSIQSITPLLAGGDYLYLRGGDYTDKYSGSGWTSMLLMDKYFSWSSPQPTASTPVTIKGYPGETAVLKGDFSQDGRNPCVFIDGVSHLVIEDLAIRDCFNNGVKLGYDRAGEDITFRNVTVSNIEYNDNSGFVSVLNYADITIENSTFHDYVPKPSTGQVGAYLKFYHVRNLLVSNNLFYGNGSGVYYKHGDDDVTSTVFQNNTFRDLTQHGIYTNKNGTEITANVFENNSGGSIVVHQEDGTSGTYTHGVTATYNTIINGDIKLNAGSGDSLGAYNFTFTNNIVRDSQYLIWIYGSDAQYTAGIGLTSDHNCFHETSGPQSIGYFSSYPTLGQSFDLSGWQSTEGFDLNSEEADPLLQPDYTLGAGSPCTSMGHTAFSG